jgi:hypothetical protein
MLPMQENGQHHVARIDDTVTKANLHARAEAIAVPDFDYVQQGIDAVISGVVHRGHKESAKPADEQR